MQVLAVQFWLQGILFKLRSFCLRNTRILYRLSWQLTGTAISVATPLSSRMFWTFPLRISEVHIAASTSGYLIAIDIRFSFFLLRLRSSMPISNVQDVGMM